MMKNTLIAGVLSLSLLTGGCTLNRIPSNVNDPAFVTVVQQNAQDARVAAAMITQIYLGTIKDAEKKAETGSVINDVAVKIRTALKESETGSLTSIRDYAYQLANNSDVEYRDVAGLIVTAIVTGLEAKLNEDLPGLKGDARFVASRSIASGAIDGVISATLSFTKKVESPTTVPTLVE